MLRFYEVDLRLSYRTDCNWKTGLSYTSRAALLQRRQLSSALLVQSEGIGHFAGGVTLPFDGFPPLSVVRN